jgi:hypothetical protein
MRASSLRGHSQPEHSQPERWTAMRSQPERWTAMRSQPERWTAMRWTARPSVPPGTSGRRPRSGMSCRDNHLRFAFSGPSTRRCRRARARPRRCRPPEDPGSRYEMPGFCRAICIPKAACSVHRPRRRQRPDPHRDQAEAPVGSSRSQGRSSLGTSKRSRASSSVATMVVRVARLARRFRRRHQRPR